MKPIRIIEKLNEAYNYFGKDTGEPGTHNNTHIEHIYTVRDQYGDVEDFKTREEAQAFIDSQVYDENDPEDYPEKPEYEIVEDDVEVSNKRIVVHDDLEESADLSNQIIYYFCVGVCLDENRPDADPEEFYDMPEFEIPYKLLDENYGCDIQPDEILRYVKHYIQNGVPGTFGVVIKSKYPYEISDDLLTPDKTHIQGAILDDIEFYDVTHYKKDGGELIYCAYSTKDDGIKVLVDNVQIEEPEPEKKQITESNFEQTSQEIFNKYRDEFDSVNEVYDLSDYINKLYSEGGMSKVDSEFFLPGASEEYKKDFKKLINKKLKEYGEPGIKRTLVEEICLCLGALYDNMGDDFYSNYESIYDWCEGGDGFPEDYFTKEEIDELVAILKEISPKVDEINRILAKHSGDERL